MYISVLTVNNTINLTACEKKECSVYLLNVSVRNKIIKKNRV